MTEAPIPRATTERTLDWVAPLEVAAGLGGRDGLLCLLSGEDDPDGRSFIAVDPDLTRADPVDGGAPFAALRAAGWDRQMVGLAAYDVGARPATGTRETVWPDLTLARYPSMLVFDHRRRRLMAVGIGDDAGSAQAACDRAASWPATAMAPVAPPAPSPGFAAEAPEAAYMHAVADVVSRIAAGELFQANIARGWRGALQTGADPFDVFMRLALAGGAPYAAFWRIGDRALVSASPELFVSWNRAAGRVETRPIKGTRGRDADPVVDAANAEALAHSAKDRAENLMIVDLMRNDLARVCIPGSVRVEALFAIESHPTVHHLVSTVTGQARGGLGPADLLEATFPPGSITGAPKHQAMKVIARHEPPRGAWCGSLFVLDAAGDMTASVLIRTASFERMEGVWRWRALAGAGIVADSDPRSELAETELKIAALRAAFVDQQSVQATVSVRRGRR